MKNTIEASEGQNMTTLAKIICISEGNMKIGKIPNFSQTPGKTCYGRTKLCSKLCYAGKADRAYPSAKLAWERNTAASIEEKEAHITAYLERKKEAGSVPGPCCWRF